MKHGQILSGIGLSALIGLSVGALATSLLNRKTSKIAGPSITSQFLGTRIGNFQKMRVYLIDAHGQRRQLRFGSVLGQALTEENDKGDLEFEFMMHTISSFEDPSIDMGRACGVIEGEVESGGVRSIDFNLTPVTLVFGMDGHRFQPAVKVSGELRQFLQKEIEQIAAADRHQHHCFTPTALQSPGGWARR